MKTEQIESSTGLYLSKATPDGGCDQYVIFVHGGPGSHCGWLELVVQELETYRQAPVGWIFYDQNACGRSPKEQPLTHDKNIDDLAAICRGVGEQLDKPLTTVFGHSYGARLAYDTFAKNSDIELRLILAGRGVYGMDSMNQSTLMDLYILRDSDPEKFQKAYELISSGEGHACDQFLNVRKLLDNDVRNSGRKKFYWGNDEAMRWYDQLKQRVGLKDSDEVFEAIRHTYIDDDSVIFDPRKLKQSVTMIKGFWDFLMAGATCQGIFEDVVTFNGSGHYPHIEEPEKFLRVLSSGCKN